MGRFNYLAVLLFIFLCAGFISAVFKVRVANFWKNFLISRKNWYFDDAQIIGLKILGKIPIEEILFFIVVPFTSLLTYLALKKLTKWSSD